MLEPATEDEFNEWMTSQDDKSHITMTIVFNEEELHWVMAPSEARGFNLQWEENRYFKNVE